MKKNISFLIIVSLGMFSFFSCEKDSVDITINSSPAPSSLQTPAGPNGLAFTKANAGNSIDFSWSAVDFGFQSATTYGVQLATSNSFADAKTLFTTSKLTGSAKVSDLNSVLLGLKYVIGSSATVKCRVFATVGHGVDTAYSSATDYTIIPYEDLIDYPMIYVPGDYQGWTPGAVNGRLFSYDFGNNYENILKLNGNGFLFTPAPNWDNKWGLGSLTLAGGNYSGTLVAGGGDMAVAAGCYVVKFNTTSLAASFTKTDYWSLIGSIIDPNWSIDYDMFYNGQRKMWEYTGDLKAGEFKFRANHDWGVNFPSSNLSLSADGNYTIRFDPVNSTYKIIQN